MITRIFLLLSAITISAHSRPSDTADIPATDLNWLSADAVQALPENLRPALSALCKGIYFNPDLAGLEDNPDAPLEISADSSQLEENGVSRLSGNLLIERGAQRIRAESIEVDQINNRADLEGPVHVEEPDATLVGKSAHMQLDTRHIEVTEAAWAAHQEHARGSASAITRPDSRTLLITRGTFTTCEPGDSSWQFRARKIQLDQEKGWGKAWQVVLWVKNVPVFYAPYLEFPLNDQRKSGFLWPAIGRSEKTGVDIAIPYYVNIAPQMDATLIPRHIHDRGNMLETEFRYLAGSPRYPQQGSLSGAFLSEDRLYENQHRKLLSWQHQGNTSRHWFLNSDINYVSDPDYFSDLGTQLSVNRTTQLNRLLAASYHNRDARTDLSLAIRVQGWQPLIDLAEKETPYTRRPELSLGYQYSFSPSLTTGIQGQLVDFQRNTHIVNDINGNRLHLSPFIRADWQNSWLSVTPKITLNHTEYRLDTVDPAANDIYQSQVDNGTLDATRFYHWHDRLLNRQTLKRTVPVVSLDNTLFLERQPPDASWVQTLEPRLFYRYASYVDQSYLPNFDSSPFSFSYNQLFNDNRFSGIDRIGDGEHLAIGLTSRFYHADSGDERFRISLGQGFYLRNRHVLSADDDRFLAQVVHDYPTASSATRESWESRIDSLLQENRQNRTPIAAQLWAQLNPFWSASSDLIWREQNNRIEDAGLTFHYQDNRFRTLNVGYSYHSDTDDNQRREQMDVSAIYPLTERWAILGRWLYDHSTYQSLESIAGIEYSACCWRIRLVGQRVLEASLDALGNETLEADKGLFLQVQLRGLGGLDQRVDSLLEDVIPGYRRRNRNLE